MTGRVNEPTAIYISIHALRGEGDLGAGKGRNIGISISIHALRGEGDAAPFYLLSLTGNFNPRPPWGGRL